MRYWSTATSPVARSLARDGRQEGAEVAFAKALARDPGAAKRIDKAWADAYLSRGVITAGAPPRTRRPRRFSPRRWRAIPAAKRIDNVRVDSYIGRGRKLLVLEQGRGGRGVFRQGAGARSGAAKRIDKTWAEGFDSRAWNKFLEGKASEGLADAEKAVALAPGGGNMLDTRAQIYLALDRVDEALAGFDAAIAAGFDTYGGTYYGRGRCHEIKGKAALAVADYSRAIELVKGAANPDDYEKTVLAEAAKRLVELGGASAVPRRAPKAKR